VVQRLAFYPFSLYFLSNRKTDRVLLQHAHFLEFGVIRTFEFVSQLRRMSVIVKRLRSTSMEIYVKGAPEVMADICDTDSCTLSRSADDARLN
jgi:magnesium-transporting ATPase (P-type)